MPADLDTRIRALVLEVVDLTPPPPDPPLREPRPGQPRRPPIVVAFVIGLAVVVVLAGVSLLHRGDDVAAPPRRGGDTVTLDLDDIPKGVSPHWLRGVPVFLVRDMSRVTAFVSSTQHLLGDTELWWCPREEVFVGPTYGEVFARSGHVLAGPASRGLDRLRTVVPVAGQVVVHLDDLIPQPRGTNPPSPEDLTGLDIRPGSEFCLDRAIAGKGRRTVTLPVASLPEGVSTSQIGRTPVFYVRSDQIVRIFVNNAQHLGDERLWWCPVERVFWAPTHGETFDAGGRVIGGPPRRGMDRIAARARDGLVTIERGKVIRGDRPRFRGATTPTPECAFAVKSGP